MPDPSPDEDELLRVVARQEARKLRARRERRRRSLWFGLGAIGVVGWSIALPTVLGVLIGHWIDERYPGPVSWSLTLLGLGALTGGLSAWRWLKRQREPPGPEEEQP
jgi:ATP synthase protein I